MRLILTILFRTVLVLLLLIATALRLRDRGERGDRIEWATSGGRVAWVHSGGGWLMLIVASPWPESRAVRWVSGTADDPIRDAYGIVIIQRQQLWGDRWGVDIKRGRAYSLTAPSPTMFGPEVRFVLVSVPHWIVATLLRRRSCSARYSAARTAARGRSRLG